MLKRRISALVLSGLLAVSMFGSVASAANATDRPFTFYITTTNTPVYTTGQTKEDYSSTYVNLKKATNGTIWCDVQGNRGTSTWYRETVGGKHIALTVGQWKVRQNVKENGGTKARLKFERYYSDGELSGVWSPDCVGSYPVAN